MLVKSYLQYESKALFPHLSFGLFVLIFIDLSYHTVFANVQQPLLASAALFYISVTTFLVVSWCLLTALFGLKKDLHLQSHQLLLEYLPVPTCKFLKVLVSFA